MKKILALTMSLTLGCLLMSCGGNNTAESGKSTDSTTSAMAAASATGENASSAAATVSSESTETKMTKANETKSNASETGKAAVRGPKKDIYKGAETPAAYESETKDGKKVTLDQFKGKVVLLTMGATWCPDCQKELKMLNKLYQSYKDNKDVVFLPTYLVDGKKETKDTIKAFYEKEKLDLPCYYGDKAILRANFQIGWIPTLMVINKEGKCVPMGKDDAGNIEYYRHTDITPELLTEKISAALEAK